MLEILTLQKKPLTLTLSLIMFNLQDLDNKN